MRKWLIYIVIFILAAQESAYSQNDKTDKDILPLSKVFYKIDKNVIHSFSYNYGLNVLVGSIGTYGLVESKIDWRWNRLSYNNSWITNTGMPSAAIGGLVPLVLPLTLYCKGRAKDDYKLQVTGLALGQAAILGLSISSAIKTYTGRRPPEILGKTGGNVNYSNDFHFGLLRRGAFNGWPSGHTMTAFAMAATMAELYPGNRSLIFWSYTYATAIGIGVSVNIHWLSDAFAGALIGYAIGKTVGSSFNSLLSEKKEDNSLSFFATPNDIGIKYTF